MRYSGRFSVDRIKNFWSYVKKTSGCWEWIGCRVLGYGCFYVGKSKTMRAHRYSYILAYKNIPRGLSIDHLCRNPACVRPDHLEAVTNRENILRGIGPTAQNAKKESCLNGHKFTKNNTYIPGLNKRHCRLCHRVRCRKAAEKRKIVKRVCEGCKSNFLAERRHIARGRARFCKRVCRYLKYKEAA